MDMGLERAVSIYIYTLGVMLRARCNCIIRIIQLLQAGGSTQSMLTKSP